MRVQRRADEVTDLLTRDGVTVVMARGQLVRLSPLSAMILALAEERIEYDELARQLEERFGAPEGRSALDATKDAVTEMIRLGVLRRSS
ncbi:hypothetical protein LL946_14640 [Knoellia locipacati]|uniref:hypothetical protein n=1 Tax=Knoellia locipacati TaxID=882824 RepID=UPI00384AAD58